jgi:hypothetical protein
MLEFGKIYQHDGFVDPNIAYFIPLGLKRYSNQKSGDTVYYIILWSWGIVDEILFDGKIAKNSKLIA